MMPLGLWYTVQHTQNVLEVCEKLGYQIAGLPFSLSDVKGETVRGYVYTAKNKNVGPVTLRKEDIRLVSNETF